MLVLQIIFIVVNSSLMINDSKVRAFKLIFWKDIFGIFSNQIAKYELYIQKL